MFKNIRERFERDTVCGYFHSGGQRRHGIGHIEGDPNSFGSSILCGMFADGGNQTKFIQHGRAQRVHQAANFRDGF